MAYTARVKEQRPDRRWYSEGLRFACQATGKCCLNRGEYAYVYVSDDEIRRLATLLELTASVFKKRYAEPQDGSWVLRSRDDACIFLEHGRCGVYQARPVQCATWPFWQENMEERVWREEVAPFCAGVGRGALYSAEKIEALVQRTDETLDDD